MCTLRHDGWRKVRRGLTTIDFEHESLCDGLRRYSISLDEPAFFSWLGVTMYLEERAIDSALSSIAMYGRQWDLAGLSPWYRYQDGAGWYQGWYEDPESMSHKYQFVLDQNLMGVGIWALGQDGSNHDLWDVLGRYFGGSSDVTGTELAGTAFRLWPNFPNPFNPATTITALTFAAGANLTACSDTCLRMLSCRCY